MAKAENEKIKQWLPATLAIILSIAIAGVAAFYFFYKYIIDVCENVISMLFKIFFSFG